MQELLFRVFNKEEKVMIDIGSMPSLTNYPMNVYEVMLFTGLLDKNGVRIYEGDIVKRVYRFTKNGKPMENIDEIVFKESWGAFAFHSKTNIGLGWSRMYDGHKVYPFEVIGNIYENKDLIK